MASKITINFFLSTSVNWKFIYFKLRGLYFIERPDGTTNQEEGDSLDDLFSAVELNLPNLINEEVWANTKDKIQTKDFRGGEFVFDLNDHGEIIKQF